MRCMCARPASSCHAGQREEARAAQQSAELIARVGSSCQPAVKTHGRTCSCRHGPMRAHAAQSVAAAGACRSGCRGHRNTRRLKARIRCAHLPRQVAHGVEPKVRRVPLGRRVAQVAVEVEDGVAQQLGHDEEVLLVVKIVKQLHDGHPATAGPRRG
eukprot:916942-Prymnesium_polylepis.1